MISNRLIKLLSFIVTQVLLLRDELGTLNFTGTGNCHLTMHFFSFSV